MINVRSNLRSTLTKSNLTYFNLTSKKKGSMTPCISYNPFTVHYFYLIIMDISLQFALANYYSLIILYLSASFAEFD